MKMANQGNYKNLRTSIFHPGKAPVKIQVCKK